MKLKKIITRLAILYLIEKISFNAIKLWYFNRKESRERVLIYVAPSDFNSVNGNEIVPDKVQHLFHLLEKMSFAPMYLMRYTYSAAEYLPIKKLFKSTKILQVTLRLSNLFAIVVKTFIERNAFKVARKDNHTVLSQFAESSLRRAIEEFNPRFILTIGATQELMTICHLLEINVIEVMHGIIDEEEITRIWGDPSMRKPNLILTWHDYYTAMVEKLNIRAISLGYPSMAHERVKNQDLKQIRILVSLGYGETQSEDPSGTLSKSLFNQIKLLESKNTKFVFRIHPVIASKAKMNKELISWLDQTFEYPEIHSPRFTTLFKSLESTDIHLTKYSSTYFEAALLGIPTIFTDDLFKLFLPKEVVDSQLAVQGGFLKENELSTIVSVSHKSPFEFMNDEKFCKIIAEIE